MRRKPVFLVPDDFSPSVTRKTVTGGCITEVLEDIEGKPTVVLSITPRNRGVELHWTIKGRATVERLDLRTKEKETLLTNGGVSSYVDVDVSPGYSYRYTVLTEDSQVSGEVKIPDDYTVRPWIGSYYFDAGDKVDVVWYGAGGKFKIQHFVGQTLQKEVLDVTGTEWSDTSPVPGYNKYVISRPFRNGEISTETTALFKPKSKSETSWGLIGSVVLIIIIILIVVMSARRRQI